ncbi:MULTISPECIES: type 1 glutamine amidotransferase [Marinobacter]|jgi:GMP synthase (glutamine-hydrolysing)|uniref:Type 1 glutamine amidotransferase n=1 Tax=Marinobacter shengliensis TaxID=1389223 RepID=A0ABV4W3I4_9GAMM|nr:hypothetical protein C9993_03070 [Marinobacter sp. Z-F4-2]|tara:strand:- start:7 stop:729 length:723 start_codon:yes stop_codon:yes gene_type:complete
MKKRFALVWCSEEERFDYKEEMLKAFEMPNSDWHLVSAFSEMEDVIDRYDGFVISGSEYSVNDDAERFLNLFTLIRKAIVKEKPIVGICFGCQSLAIALGGHVGRNLNKKFRFGVDRLRFKDSLRKVVGIVEQDLGLIESHGECVINCPPGSEILAESKSTSIEIFTPGPYALGIQGHPELSKETVETDFLRVHLADRNIQESELEHFRAEILGYKPPELIRKLVKMVLQKQINLGKLVG